MAAVAVSFFMVGMFIFYTWGQVNNEWHEWYFLWDKSKDLLLLTSIYLVSSKPYKFGLICVVIFATIRFIWQIISYFTGANINNTVAIGWLFITLALIVSLVILKDLVKWRN